MRADLIVDWAADIYVDLARHSGYDLLPGYHQLDATIRQVVGHPFQPMPDPAALVVAARLLHHLTAVRGHVPFGVGSTWSLVETYLLLHGCTVAAGNEEVAGLLDSLRQERVDTTQTLSILATMTEPADR